MRCKICGDQAIGTNFGVISCTPCRAFFQRHGLDNIRGDTTLKCRFFNGSCQINKITRKYCKYCRLAACLQAGMRRNPNTPNENTQNRQQFEDKCRSLVEQKYKYSQLVPLDLLQTDRSSLNTNQWNLISNITHIYDTLFEQHKQNISQFEIYHEQKPVKLRLKISNFQQLLSTYFTFIVPFLEHIPDYQSLDLSNQMTLVHNNLFMLTGFHYHYMMSITGFIPYFHKNYAPIMNIIYGNEVILENEKLRQKLDSILHADLFLIKLVIVTFAFSNITPCLIFSSQFISKSMKDEVIFSKRLLEIQNNYINILWRYMLFRFRYDKLVTNIFSDIIYYCLQAQKNTSHVAELNHTHKHMIDTLIEESERKLNFQDGL